MAVSRLAVTPLLAAVIWVTVACTAAPAPAPPGVTTPASDLIPTGQSSGQPTAPDTTGPPPDIDAAQFAAIDGLIQQINGSATAVDRQQAMLQTAVHPDYADEQRSCTPASITVRLDPAYPDLRPDPGWKPPGAAAAPSGTLYRLPALVEVYTDGLRTGTDLTLLRVAVLDGVARTFPLCLV